MRKANQNEEVEAPARRENSDPVAVVISRRAADRLRAGHVWVYQSDVIGLNFEQENAPSLVSVTDQRGIFLGVGLYSASSQIALRVVSREALDEAQWLAMLQERLRLAIRRRRSMLDVENDACRLAFSEADELPGLVADKYGEIVVLQLLAKGLDNQPTRDAVMAVLRDELLPATIVERPDPRIRELEQLSTPADGPLYARDAAEPLLKTIFRLNDLSFHFDVTAGQKTGAFLDQRENYAAAARYAHGESLDVCTYQGGFALHLATACSRVTGVDVSRAALEVAEQNLALNRDKLVAGVDWLEANAFDLLRDWSDAGSTYDTIVLDPPAFAKSKRATEGALRGYKELNLRAIKMLRPEGVLVTCSCSHHVSLADFQAVVAAAAADAGRRVTLLERRGAAADHPFVLTLPETEYLKCLICRVS
ncbi:MAG: class I SAM-dependent rRNA methyltransferase [Acidobacteria bacterium]|nr:class I SAM-dependent rRNA methyltransferase [Acidobacteriota bacterium]MBW4046255.1 class I SAM-dependent rRNA methyltransferase [Acidobacteriota bacterium]